MLVNILVVDTDTQPGMELISMLALPQVKVTFVDQLTQALKNVKKNQYTFIVLGDRIKGGNTYDIGLEIAGGKRNKRTPVICIGINKGRNYKLVKVLGSYGIKYDVNTITTLINYLEAEEVKSQGREVTLT